MATRRTDPKSLSGKTRKEEGLELQESDSNPHWGKGNPYASVAKVPPVAKKKVPRRRVQAEWNSTRGGMELKLYPEVSAPQLKNKKASSGL